MKLKRSDMSMKQENMADVNIEPGNIPAQREAFEYNKYGRRMQQEAAAHPHVYTKHSLPLYGQYSEPSSPEMA